MGQTHLIWKLDTSFERSTVFVASKNMIDLFSIWIFHAYLKLSVSIWHHGSPPRFYRPGMSKGCKVSCGISAPQTSEETYAEPAGKGTGEGLWCR